MRTNSRFILSILCIFFIFLSTTKSYAVQVIPCSYWYSNTDSVAYWATTPSVSKISLGSPTWFSSSVDSARSQWASAGISTSSGGTSSSANIVCYGGTRTALYQATGYSYEGKMGLTVGSSTFVCFLDYNGSISYRLKQQSSQQIVGIVDDDYANTLNTSLHELGHALGWQGHYPSSGKVMYYAITGVTSLQSQDKLHLNQFY